MIKKIIYLIKRMVLSGFFIYGYNILAGPLNVIIPLNMLTVFIISFFGIPALFALILIRIIIF